MAKSKFYLKEPQATQDTPVIFFFSFGGQRLKYYTGESILPSRWNERQRMPRNEENSSVLANLTIRLNRIRTAAEEEYSRLLLLKEIPTLDKIRHAIDQAVGKVENTDHRKTLQGYIEHFIRDREKDPRYKKGSITVYRTTQKHVMAYAPKPVLLDAIDKDFLKGFVRYLQGQTSPITGNYFTGNHVHKICSTLKTIFSQAIEDDVTTNPVLLKKSIFPSKDKPTKIALSKEEIKRIYYLDLPAINRADGVPYHSDDLKYLEISRDLFCMACFTGLRYSDFSRLKQSDFIKEGETWFLSKRTLKTYEDVLVPLNPLAVELVMKYDGKFPQAVSNQKMNENLKTIGKAAGIDDVVSVTRKEGGVSVTREYQKWELITTHTGRRSMVTNSLNDDVPTETIKQLGGWKSSSSFEKYNKTKQKEHAKRAAKHNHFKKY